MLSVTMCTVAKKIEEMYEEPEEVKKFVKNTLIYLVGLPRFIFYPTGKVEVERLNLLDSERLLEVAEALLMTPKEIEKKVRDFLVLYYKQKEKDLLKILLELLRRTKEKAQALLLY